jgi:hypothetical protein
MKRLKGFLGVLLIFVFGVFVGIVLSQAGIDKKIMASFEGGPMTVFDHIESRLRQQLKLDKSQQEMLHAILLDLKIKLSAIRQKTEPESAEAILAAEQRLRGILHQDQLKRFDEIVRKGHEKWQFESAPATPAATAGATPAATPGATSGEPPKSASEQ